MKKVLLADVAKSLGVSKTLVSMVINGKADENGISKETQKRVLQKIKELGYKPNPMARGLRKGRTDTIGLVVSDISNEFYAKIARYVENFARHLGVSTFVCSTDEIVEKEIALINMLKQRRVDGIIVSSSQINKVFFRQLIAERFPFVLIDRKIETLEANFVGVDNFKAAYDAIHFLHNKDYKNIYAMAVSPFQVSTIKNRIEGFVIAEKQFGTKSPHKKVIRIPFDSLEKAVKAEMYQLFNAPNRPDAIFTINNNLAKYVLREITALGLRIPQDIAIISFDDIEVFDIIHPGITAISQPIENICKVAVRALFEEINSQDKEPKPKKDFILPTQLIIRGSV